MVYLKKMTDAQVLFIPRNGEETSGGMSLYLENTTDHQEKVLEVSDLQTSGLYYNLAVNLPEDVASGEWRYRLEADGIAVSCGLLFIGDLSSPYQLENNIKYKQYERD